MENRGAYNEVLERNANAASRLLTFNTPGESGDLQREWIQGQVTA
jgi:hypothetical protein